MMTWQSSGDHDSHFIAGEMTDCAEGARTTENH